MADGDSQTPRVAIKLGSSVSSAKGTKQPRKADQQGRRHRAHALDQDDDSQSEDEEYGHHGRHELITGYGPSGASHEKDCSEHRRVRDSKESENKSIVRKRQRTRSPSRDRRDDADRLEEKPIKYGLTINKKPAGERSERDDRHESSRAEPQERKKPLAADEEAIEALMNGSSKSEKRKRDTDDSPGRDPQEEDYRAIPVDDFGATLLKRFGWDGKMRGQVKEVKRNANLAGLGARNVKDAEDLGAWEQKKNKDERRPKLEEHRREEEKKRRRLEDSRGDYSYKQERDRERDRGRDRDRDRGSGRDRR